MTEYWIWLSRCLGAGAKIGDMLSYFGSPKAMYEAGSHEWRLSGLLTSKQISSLTKFSPSESSDVLKQCQENRWYIVDASSPFYPTLLRSLPDFPAVLFVNGDYNVLKCEVPIAFVGTRKASAHSENIAMQLASSVASSGATVVSGGALGIDSASHEGALNVNCKTIAVLGCGLGSDYLMENKDLRQRISKSGAVISEFLPFTPASRTTFPIRNRIISGMSLGTVVIEASEKSGSLITSNLALSQGRDVFAVPGDIISSSYSGANKLIRDGATPVFSAIDILSGYACIYPHVLDLSNIDSSLSQSNDERKRKISLKEKLVKTTPKKVEDINDTPKSKKTCPNYASKNAKIVYNVFENTPLHIDEITVKSNLPSNEVLGSLTELELFGLISLQNGRKYQIK